LNLGVKKGGETESFRKKSVPEEGGGLDKKIGGGKLKRWGGCQSILCQKRGKIKKSNRGVGVVK